MVRWSNFPNLSQKKFEVWKKWQENHGVLARGVKVVLPLISHGFSLRPSRKYRGTYREYLDGLMAVASG
jgi:hypothetical protein